MQRVLFAGLIVLAACETRPPARDAAAADTTPAHPTRLHAEAGFSTPESVVHDTVADVYFVSSINGNPGAKDGNGFISRMRPDGTVDSLRFIAGGRDGATLNGPKGMAIRGDTIWVADIDAMRAFDRRTGAALGTVDFGDRAAFLNDVAIGPDGMVYVSETGVRFTESGEMQSTGTAGVFRLGRDGAIELVARDTALAAPNGITAHAGKLLMGSFAGPQIFAWAPGQEGLARMGMSTSGIDGLEVLADGRVLASTWSDSSIVVIGDSPTRLITGLPSPADFTIDRARRRIIVPLFNDDRVEIWQLP
ncbi:MAG TPA: hypothetical protein VFT04_14080 [Gemmatimonadales bacterium]|nr:hypothetical protein [Gemmatimonadales bacterium]